MGHNVVIGQHCIIVADTAIGGSSDIGDFVTMAAQVELQTSRSGPYSVLVARTGVTRVCLVVNPINLTFYSGFPVGPHEEKRKEMVYPRKIPKILSRLKTLEKGISESEE